MFLVFSHFTYYMNSGTAVSPRSMDCSSASTSKAGHGAFDGLVGRFGHKKFWLFITQSVGVEHEFITSCCHSELSFKPRVTSPSFERRRKAEAAVPDSEVQILAVWKFHAKSTFKSR